MLLAERNLAKCSERGENRGSACWDRSGVGYTSSGCLALLRRCLNPCHRTDTMNKPYCRFFADSQKSDVRYFAPTIDPDTYQRLCYPRMAMVCRSTTARFPYLGADALVHRHRNLEGNVANPCAPLRREFWQQGERRRQRLSDVKTASPDWIGRQARCPMCRVPSRT
jgi:hypothetical protein